MKLPLSGPHGNDDHDAFFQVSGILGTSILIIIAAKYFTVPMQQNEAEYEM
jgi:hypothetical protein